jgi:hypothetical protein
MHGKPDKTNISSGPLDDPGLITNRPLNAVTPVRNVCDRIAASTIWRMFGGVGIGNAIE